MPVAGLHELGERTRPGARVDERDEVAAEATPRGCVDQLDARGGELVEGGADVGDAEGHVMQPFAARLEKAGDRPVGIQGGDQLDARRRPRGA